MNIQEYCDILNIEINLKYYPNQNGRWCANFDHCEFKDTASSRILASTYGNGFTPQAAIEDFLEQIRGKLMVINATDENKSREYIVPDSLSA